MTAALEVVGGTVVIDGAVILHEVDLRVDDGEFVVLLGANGSGKSTLVRATLGLVDLAAGEARLFGNALRSFEEWPRVGYVPQRFTAASGVPASVEEVVLSVRMARGRRVKDADREAARAALEAVGLQGKGRTPVDQLSVGQQQRVLIARAMAADPDLLVLDEPVSGVDIEHQQSFAATLARLKTEGRSVLLVAHALASLEPLVDRAVVLDGGHVVYDGPPLPEQVFASHVHHHPAEGAHLHGSAP